MSSSSKDWKKATHFEFIALDEPAAVFVIVAPHLEKIHDETNRERFRRTHPHELYGRFQRVVATEKK
jgi:hypothetical protein